MTVLMVTVPVLAAAVVVLLTGLWWWITSGVVRSKVRERLVVTLKSGASFHGVLFRADRSAWVLRDVVAMGVADRDDNAPVDGELLLFVSDIDYVQRP